MAAIEEEEEEDAAAEVAGEAGGGGAEGAGSRRRRRRRTGAPHSTCSSTRARCSRGYERRGRAALQGRVQAARALLARGAPPNPNLTLTLTHPTPP